MQDFNSTFPNLSASGNDQDVRTLVCDIGKLVRFKGLSENSIGSIAFHGIFKIVGIQKDFSGKLCYRVKCIQSSVVKGDYHDEFGRVMSLENAEFIENNILCLRRS